MKSSSIASLLLLMIFISATQGIRLEKGFLKSVDEENKIDVDESSSTGSSNGGVGLDYLIAGKSRKLVTVSSSSSSSTSSESENGGQRKEESMKRNPWATVSENGQSESSHDHYPDMADITEMDYSPARRKSPIHN